MIFPPGPIDSLDFPDLLQRAYDSLMTSTVKPAMDKCVDLAREQVTKQFEGEMDPDGNPWPPWQWTSDYPPEPHKTLQLTGTLKQSFTSTHGANVEVVEDRSLTYGSNLKYASIHDQGASFVLKIWLFGRNGGALPPGTKITIPARPIAGWSQETLERCETVIADYWEAQLFG